MGWGPHLLLFVVGTLAVFALNDDVASPTPNTTAWDHPGWACLRRTTPNLELQYPTDAEEHFEEIHRALAAWAQPPGHVPHRGPGGFQGPWVENVWIDRARHLNASRFRSPRFGAWRPLPLSAVFGPFIPLLLTWVDSWVSNTWHYPKPFLRLLQKLLRPNVPYVTVSQNDEGLTGKCELLMEDHPNILVFSAGGYGHIPIPLFMADMQLNNAKPIEKRKYLVSYVGTLDHAPGNLRGQMKDIVEQQARRHNFTYSIYKGPWWQEQMADSRVSLVPRGWGRTAYHLAETIQMGLIPVYIYSDVPWVPYRLTFRRFGYSVNLTALPQLLTHLSKLPASAFVQKERAVEKARELFLPKGVIQQVLAYLAEDPHELRCVTLPKTPKGERPCRSR